jgi:hypothetical protein
MYLNAGCEITFAVANTTPMILMIRPHSGLGQWVAQQSYTLSPLMPPKSSRAEVALWLPMGATLPMWPLPLNLALPN